MQRYTNIQTIGLCHSVQVCAKHLLTELKMEEYVDKCRWEIAGVNHQAWLLKITDLQGNDLYPEIKRRALHPELYDIKRLGTPGYDEKLWLLYNRILRARF